MSNPFDLANAVRRHGRSANVNAWTRYVPKEEPPEVAAAWDAASKAIEAARVAEEERHDRKASRVRMAEMYGHLRRLRALGTDCGMGLNARHGSPRSSLVVHGEHPERAGADATQESA